LVATHEDITERTQSEARIAHLPSRSAHRIPNRSAFGNYLAKTFQSASAGDETFALLCIDLDRFKEINHMYGHRQAIAFLKEIGRRAYAGLPRSVVSAPASDESVTRAAACKNRPVASQRKPASDLLEKAIACRMTVISLISLKSIEVDAKQRKCFVAADALWNVFAR